MSRRLLSSTEVLPVHGSGGKDEVHEMKGPGRRRSGQQTVLFRLQSLFPGSPISPRTPSEVAHLPVEPKLTPDTPSRPPPRFLKVHVVSWNMHESLPKGNLEELLGTVPPYVPCPEDETDRLRIPNLSAEDGHPYHLVVVAGQECPTVSGIPLGIGASFRHKEKDKTKDGEKGAKKARVKDGKEKDKDEISEVEVFATNNLPFTPTGDAHSSASTHGPTSGWSWILEEWYCHGLGHRGDSAGTSSASELYDSQAASVDAGENRRPPGQSDVDTQHEDDKLPEKDRKARGGDKKRKYSCKDKSRVGPYELLVKDRLMGIYVAIFIYRDLKPLVRGVSKSSVSTGLIGGRVGNKGGVGISVNLDGTTLLFMNAHLAAHEGRVMNRVANYTKIKSELQVNDFLLQDDPRVMSEDLTDKFDYTFLFGDLNFRLDVTRLHADWLISRQDYDQALSFDQLRKLMKNGEAFVGFNEAPIRFPPTFKYDVVKTIKRDRSDRSRELGRARGSKRWLVQRSNPNLSELHETDAELSARFADEEQGGLMDADDDNGSFVSTTVTALSMRSGSRGTANGDSGNNDGFARSISPKLSNQTRDDNLAANDSVAKKLFIAKAALKAKAKWLSIVKSKASSAPVTRRVSKMSQRSSFSASFPQLKSRASRSDSRSSAFRAAASAVELGRPSATSFGELRRTSSKKSLKSVKSTKLLTDVRVAENARQECDSGVYDSSSKQRVPSWCDRIMWKTTVRPEPESNDENDEPTLSDHRTSGLGPRVFAFLSSLRPRATRARTTSLTSLPSLSTTDAPPPLPQKDTLRPATARSDTQPLLIQTSRKESALVKVKSIANIVTVLSLPQKKARNPKLLKSRSVEPTSTTPLVSSSIRRRRSRAYTAMPVISAPVVTFPENAETGSVEPPPVPPKDHVGRLRTTSNRGWLRLPFFSKETEIEPLASTLKLDAAEKQEATPSRPRRPRRGEVVPLNYNSLDDQAMRRLEGRSDHRPVIGSYAVYI